MTNIYNTLIIITFFAISACGPLSKTKTQETKPEKLKEDSAKVQEQLVELERNKKTKEEQLRKHQEEDQESKRKEQERKSKAEQERLALEKQLKIAKEAKNQEEERKIAQQLEAKKHEELSWLQLEEERKKKHEEQQAKQQQELERIKQEEERLKKEKEELQKKADEEQKRKAEEERKRKEEEKKQHAQRAQTIIAYQSNGAMDLDKTTLSEEDFFKILNELGINKDDQGAPQFTKGITPRAIQHELAKTGLYANGMYYFIHHKHLSQDALLKAIQASLGSKIVGKPPSGQQPTKNPTTQQPAPLQEVIIKSRIKQDNIWQCGFAVAYNIEFINKIHQEIYNCPNTACIENLFANDRDYAKSVNDQKFIQFQNKLATTLYPGEVLKKGAVNLANGAVIYGDQEKYLIPQNLTTFADVMVIFDDLGGYAKQQPNSDYFNPQLLQAFTGGDLDKLLKEFLNKQISYANIASLTGGGGGHYVLVTLTRFNNGNNTAIILLDSSDTKDFAMGNTAVSAIKQKLETLKTK